MNDNTQTIKIKVEPTKNILDKMKENYKRNTAHNLTYDEVIQKMMRKLEFL